MERSEVLFIGGRSGVGKSTAANALHELLVERDVRHAVIEGDTLDDAHPMPYLAHPDARLAERNLRTMWANYRDLGYRRLIYTNTASVVVLDDLLGAMGDDPAATAVLLRSSDATAAARLAHRRGGETVTAEAEHSAATAARLDDEAGPAVHRLVTDGLTPPQVAARLLELVGWADPAP